MTGSVPASLSRFVWRDLMTTRVEEAKAFYAFLFGWEIVTIEMGEDVYDIFRIGEQEVGGIMPVGTGEQIASHWLAYLNLPDVDRACTVIEEQGGELRVSPVAYPEVGRVAVASDPVGALFAPFEKHMPDDVDHDAPAPPFTFCWTELLCEKPDAVLDFYAALAGWKTASVAGEPAVRIFTKGSAPVASARAYPPDQVAPALWLNHVHVPDCAEWFEHALRLGARPVAPPTPVPAMGRYAVVIDVVGAPLGLWTPSTPSP